MLPDARTAARYLVIPGQAITVQLLKLEVIMGPVLLLIIRLDIFSPVLPIQVQTQQLSRLLIQRVFSELLSSQLCFKIGVTVTQKSLTATLTPTATLNKKISRRWFRC